MSTIPNTYALRITQLEQGIRDICIERQRLTEAIGRVDPCFDYHLCEWSIERRARKTPRQHCGGTNCKICGPTK